MDWITDFLSLTETIRSPTSFRLWTAISTIAAVLERRVWTITDGPDPLYPNLYVVLAGAPASGKTMAIGIARKMLTPLCEPGGHGIHLGPDNPSAASFMDSLGDAVRISINGMGVPFYCAMTVLCTELGDLISKYDKDFVAKLTTLYDNPPSYAMPRRISKSLTVETPCVNLIAAATPAAIGDIIPESAWGQGFTSRLIFIYGGIPTLRRRIFQKRQDADANKLISSLKTFFKELHGVFEWEPDAQAAMERWFNDEKLAPVPNYGRLVNYCGRRDVHVMKLAMVSAVSAGNGLTVTLADFRRAQRWLFEAEITMPDVFRAMAQKSDSQLLQDCHHWLYVRYSRVDVGKRVSIPETEIGTWLENKVPHEKIPSLISALEKTGRIRPGGFKGTWIPNPIDPLNPDEVIIEPNPELDPPTSGDQLQ